jgi:hypothetical protein
MTVGELISILEDYHDKDVVMLEIDGIIDECVNVYQVHNDEIIIGGTQ